MYLCHSCFVFRRVTNYPNSNFNNNKMKLFYQIIYSPILNFVFRNVNKFLRNIFPTIKIAPSGIIKIRLANEKEIKFKTNQTDFVAFCVFWNGLYKYEYTYIFEKIIKNLDGFIDIGSNAGLYSLMAAKNSENIKIIAFDPTEAANYYMNENIRLNNLSHRIQYFKLAISDKSEKLDFFEVRSKKYSYLKYNLGGSSSPVNFPTLYNTVSVQAHSLDHFLKEFSFEEVKIDFIKIDAEGAEPNIISGMKHTIKKFKPIIVCEVLLENAGHEIETLFSEFGYEFFLNKSRTLIPVTSIEKNILDNEIYNYFLVHPSKRYLVEEFIIN